MALRDLSPADLATPRFLELLRMAAELPDEELARLRDEELPTLSIIGAVGDGGLDAFAAVRIREDGLEIEYIASRVRGLGSALVSELRRRHPGVVIVAETDDDAIGFYRRLGFTDVPAPADPRWPGRPRYRCTLPAL
ncbi:GNAT family N-acetyltransferase [Rathayibacter sp. VKM Ac-2754]|uniref:GNAT family N-acetyltransferase n=1 Tax=Rathayibacter sp. VKM Ac-2754 TaxID=2609251 RepID=UPI001357F6C2|nr:GNAT family N-acetyltransferase [Rathayibacter sp. VKM Ac-2754]MWV60663.1 N-acetyltransferase [Rathayibacter sp. VKM Ac-2754]